jgi:hypothetical protein
MIAPYLQLMRQALHEKASPGSKWLTWGLLASSILVTLGFGLWLQHWQAGLLMGDVLLGVVAILWWARLVSVSVQQNLPSHACLVPQLRRRLMWVVTASFVAVVPVLAAIAALAIGHFGYLLCALAALFPFTLLQQRYAWLSLLPSVIIFSVLSWLKAPLQALMQIASGVDEPLIAVLLLCAIAELGVISLRAAFPRGGDAHADWRAAWLLRQSRLKGDVRGVDQRRGLIPWSALRNAWRTLGLRVSSGGRVLMPADDAMQYGLGISVYASALVAPVMALLGWFAVAFFAMLDDRLDLLKNLYTYAELLVVVSVPSSMQAMLTVISQRTNEQSLLRLVPAMPAAPALNAALMRLMLKGFVLLWASSALCVSMLEYPNVAHWRLDGGMMLILVLPLPFFLIMLRDFAAMSARQVPPAVVLTVLTTAAWLFASILRAKLPWLCGWVALAVVAISLMMIRQRWQGMLKAPVAFPAGRLA